MPTAILPHHPISTTAGAAEAALLAAGVAAVRGSGEGQGPRHALRRTPGPARQGLRQGMYQTQSCVSQILSFYMILSVQMTLNLLFLLKKSSILPPAGAAVPRRVRHVHLLHPPGQPLRPPLVRPDVPVPRGAEAPGRQDPAAQRVARRRPVGGYGRGVCGEWGMVKAVWGEIHEISISFWFGRAHLQHRLFSIDADNIIHHIDPF